MKFGNWFDKQQMSAWPWKTRLIQAIGNLRLEDQFRSEIKFFQDIWPHIDSVQLPKVYYAAVSDRPNVNTWSYVLFDNRTRLRFCVLMEDLAVQQFTPVRPGEGLSYNRAKQALLNIARLHAFGWNQPELLGPAATSAHTMADLPAGRRGAAEKAPGQIRAYRLHPHIPQIVGATPAAGRPRARVYPAPRPRDDSHAECTECIVFDMG